MLQKGQVLSGEVRACEGGECAEDLEGLPVHKDESVPYEKNG